MSMKTSKKIELFDVSDYPKVTQYYNNWNLSSRQYQRWNMWCAYEKLKKD